MIINNRCKAIPSSRHQLAAATPYRTLGPTPESIIYIPEKLNMWGNDTYGDCVTAEEAFAKACYNPEIYIPTPIVEAWALLHGSLNGANIATVLTAMQRLGFLMGLHLYNDGPHYAVDWTDAPTLKNAISQGPVKIGVAAAQLLKVVPNPPTSGWIATGFKTDSNIDHCVSLCGFGTVGWLASKLGVPVPADVDGAQPAYALYTWDSIGIIDVPSLLAICGEAWLRTPTTVIKKVGL